MPTVLNTGTRLAGQKLSDAFGDSGTTPIVVSGKSVRIISATRFTALGADTKRYSANEFFFGEVRFQGHAVPVIRQRYGKGNRKTWTAVSMGASYSA